MEPEKEKPDAMATKVFEAAFAVHTQLGPGLLESAYKACLAFELTFRGMEVQQEVPVPVVYRG